MRAVIAEDNALLREGLTRVLEASGIQVIAAVETADSLKRVVQSTPVDIVITDIRMPPSFKTEGLEAVVALRQEQPQLPVLVLSQYVEHLYARELLATVDGAVGYLLKDHIAQVGDFVEAVQNVVSGGTVLDPKVVARLVTYAEISQLLDRLTPREREVLELIAQGRSNMAIAAQLF